MSQEGLGRLFNVVPIIGGGAAIALRDSETATFVCTGADTFTLTIATAFAGTYRASAFFTPNWVPIDHYYANSATNGTAAWVRTAQAAASAVTIAAGMAVFSLHAASMPDTYKYVKCTASSAGLVAAIIHDLTQQRKPDSMPLPGA